MNRKSIAEKSTRLHKGYRVILLGRENALVVGNRDTYDVIRLSHRWTCNCLWGRYKSHWCECSHILAVRKALKDPSSQAPVARLAELLHDALYTTRESA